MAKHATKSIPRGDTGLVRKALQDAHFIQEHGDEIFNDKNKTFRRIKIAGAAGIFAAPQFAQEDLDRRLKAAFGDRWITAYFIQDSCHWRHGDKTAKVLCIKLTH